MKTTETNKWKTEVQGNRVSGLWIFRESGAFFVFKKLRIPLATSGQIRFIYQFIVLMALWHIFAFIVFFLVSEGLYKGEIYSSFVEAEKHSINSVMLVMLAVISSPFVLCSKLGFPFIHGTYLLASCLVISAFFVKGWFVRIVLIALGLSVFSFAGFCVVYSA